MQRRFEPIENRLAGGCSFLRPIAHLLSEAGFTITDIDVFYAKGGSHRAGSQDRPSCSD